MMSWLIDRPSPVPSPAFGGEERIEYFFHQVLRQMWPIPKPRDGLRETLKPIG
jgi:hypothetical protein